MNSPCYGKLGGVDTLRFCSALGATQTNIMMLFSGVFMGRAPINCHISKISVGCPIRRAEDASLLFLLTLSSRPQQIEITAERKAMKKMAKPGIWIEKSTAECDAVNKTPEQPRIE